jgi:hypothetical protein
VFNKQEENTIITFSEKKIIGYSGTGDLKTCSYTYSISGLKDVK